MNPVRGLRSYALFTRTWTGSRSLLVGFEYDEHRKPGPPFSVDAADVERLYSPHFAIRELERIDIIDSSPKFAAAGVTSLHEVVYALTRR